MTTFIQLIERLKSFLRDWLLVLGLKKCLVECATLCVKSEVILLFMAETGFKVFSRGVPKESSTIGPLEHLDPAYSKTKILGLVFFHFSTF